MSTQHANRGKMRWLKMDMTALEFPDASFDVVLDKGALDALMCDHSEEVSISARFLRGRK